MMLVKGTEGRIPPDDINIDPELGFTHFWNAFGNSETETSAYFLVKMAQARGSWAPFSQSDIEEIYSQYHEDGFTFNNLLGEGYIVELDGNYYFTQEFVLATYKCSPYTPVKMLHEQFEYHKDKTELLVYSRIGDVFYATPENLNEVIEREAYIVQVGYVVLDTKLPFKAQVSGGIHWQFSN